jgi:hypothetical protein
MADKRCGQCQAVVSNIAQFCPRCGRTLSGASPHFPSLVAPSAQVSNAPAQTQSGVGLIVSLAVLLFGVLLMVGLFGPVSSSTSFQSPLSLQPSRSIIRDGNGQEITDPGMRAAIEAAIQNHSH